MMGSFTPSLHGDGDGDDDDDNDSADATFVFSFNPRESAASTCRALSDVDACSKIADGLHTCGVSKVKSRVSEHRTSPGQD